MVGLRVLKEARPKRLATRKKTKTISRSNILKHIVSWLEAELYSHMLYWVDKEKNEFEIKFVHMNNPAWRSADYLAVFKGLDELSSQYEKYVQDEKYEHCCKIRCKSNLRKLDKSGAITYVGKRNQGKSIHFRKYKINIDVNVKNLFSEVSKMEKYKRKHNRNINGLGGCESVLEIAFNKGRNKTETLLNEQSHYLCLSNCSSASPVGPTILNTCCLTENINEGITDSSLLIDPLSIYEHEKQMNGINVAVLPSSIENSALNSSTHCFIFEENNNCNSMEFNELLVKEFQSVMKVQNITSKNFNDESKTLTHLVPVSFPLNLAEINEPLSEWCEKSEIDISKALQQDDDPYLTSVFSEILSSGCLEGNEEKMPIDLEARSFLPSQ